MLFLRVRLWNILKGAVLNLKQRGAIVFFPYRTRPAMLQSVLKIIAVMSALK